MIVPFDRMMSDFDMLMKEILIFIGHNISDELNNDIKNTDIKQRNFQSDHKYDLSKFGLTEQKIIEDCKPIYETFLNKK